MKELLKIFSVLFFISLITFSTIGVFAEDSGISNNTNITNNTNGTNKTVTSNAIIQPMSLFVSISVTPPSVDFGTLPADGIEYIRNNAAIVQVNATNFIIGGSGELRVRAVGDFTRGTDTSRTIALNNFQYDCLGNASKRQFTPTDYVIDQYNAGFIGTIRNTYYMNYYLTIPTGTDPGTYNTTIIYTAT